MSCAVDVEDLGDEALQWLLRRSGVSEVTGSRAPAT